MRTHSLVQSHLEDVSFLAQDARDRWWTVTHVEWEAAPLILTLRCTAFRPRGLRRHRTLTFTMGGTGANFALRTGATLEVIRAIQKENHLAVQMMLDARS